MKSKASSKSSCLYLLITRLFAIVVFVFISSNVNAGCPIVAHVAGPGTLSVNPSTPNGSVVGNITISWATTPPSSCAVVGNPTAKYTFTGLGTPNGNLYPTGIDGLSYRGRLPGWDYAGLSGWWPTTAPWPVDTTDSSRVSAGSAFIEFVKTGPISSAGGNFGPTTIMNGTIDDGAWLNIFMDNAIIIKPTAPACTVTQSAITVTLEDASVGDLNTVGSTAKEKDFTLPLKCDRQANISISFSGTVADQANGVFKNTVAETTDTVGIQLLDKNSNPVLAGAGHELPVGKLTGTLNYAMKARYYALAPDSPGGDVSSVIYATIIYN